MQTKTQSFIETLISIGIGYVISLALTYTVLPLFGYDVTVSDSVGISLIFTVVSIVRSYAVRRFFNWRHSRM